MPLLLASLLGGLLQIAGSMVGRVLLQLGLSYVVFSGINIGFDFLKSAAISNMQGAGADVVQLLGYLWVDKAVSLVISTYTAALALKLAGGTNVTKMVLK
jgi:hypothetical protein